MCDTADAQQTLSHIHSKGVAKHLQKKIVSYALALP
jgi:hypothetical protein